MNNEVNEMHNVERKEHDGVSAAASTALLLEANSIHPNSHSDKEYHAASVIGKGSDPSKYHRGNDCPWLSCHEWNKIGKPVVETINIGGQVWTVIEIGGKIISKMPKV